MGLAIEANEKVLVIGSGGSGKSTLARRLAKTTGLPLIHLDAIYWRSGWDKMPTLEWVSTVERLVKQPEWIMDGNYSGTLELRLRSCDTVIVMDTSPWLCLWRVLKRTIFRAGQERSEIPPGCNERLDAKFLWWVATYRFRYRHRILAMLNSTRHSGMSLVLLRNTRESERFLSDLAPTD